MTENDMTLTELMIERTPPRVMDGRPLRVRVRGNWMGWLVKRYGWLGDHADWNRKF